ncbi:MAG TPA: hypothetical protein DCS87_11730 [Rheinheimera sp.]|nr:hypothetical protein [Rheinheimera sp.]
MNIPQAESWFTSTGKGLLTILIIGMAYNFLDVQLITTTIKIPALPEVRINNALGFQHLFLCFLFYAIYRYALHNSESLLQVMTMSLGKYLASTKCRFLISDIFADPTIECSYEIGGNPINQVGSVLVKIYPHGKGEPGRYLRFTLAFENWRTVSIFMNCERIDLDLFNDVLLSYGVKRADVNYLQNGKYELSKTSLNDQSSYKLMSYSLLRFCPTMLTNKVSFDFAFPLVSCLILAVYNSVSIIRATFGA